MARLTNPYKSLGELSPGLWAAGGDVLLTAKFSSSPTPLVGPKGRDGKPKSGAQNIGNYGRPSREPKIWALEKAGAESRIDLPGVRANI